MPELNETEVAAWSAAAEGLPFAALAELIISVRCLGYDLDEAALNLRALDSNSPDSDFFSDEEEQQAQAAGSNGQHE